MLITVGRRGVETFTVDAHARSDDEPADREADHGLEQHRRSLVVGRGILGDLVHTLSDSDARSEVVDDLDSLERAFHGVPVSYVTHAKLDALVQIRRRFALAVHLRQ
jgi:hypothetical protein